MPDQQLGRAELEVAIAERQRSLAATLDELSRRLEPSRLAREGVAGVQSSARSAVVDTAGRPRTERIAAVLAAVVVVIVVSVIARVRTRRRSS